MNDQNNQDNSSVNICIDNNDINNDENHYQHQSDNIHYESGYVDNYQHESEKYTNNNNNYQTKNTKADNNENNQNNQSNQKITYTYHITDNRVYNYGNSGDNINNVNKNNNNKHKHDNNINKNNVDKCGNNIDNDINDNNEDTYNEYIINGDKDDYKTKIMLSVIFVVIVDLTLEWFIRLRSFILNEAKNNGHIIDFNEDPVNNIIQTLSLNVISLIMSMSIMLIITGIVYFIWKLIMIISRYIYKFVTNN